MSNGVHHLVTSPATGSSTTMDKAYSCLQLLHLLVLSWMVTMLGKLFTSVLRQWLRIVWLSTQPYYVSLTLIQVSQYMVECSDQSILLYARCLAALYILTLSNVIFSSIKAKQWCQLYWINHLGSTAHSCSTRGIFCCGDSVIFTGFKVNIRHMHACLSQCHT